MDTPKKNKHIGLLYIEKNKGTWYTTNFTKPFVLSFPQDIVSDLEIVDVDKFNQLLASFITKKEIQPMNFFIILGKDVIFEKELVNIPLSLLAAEEEKFLEMVPITHILMKTYNFNSKTLIIAASKDFCEAVIHSLQESQCGVVGVIPLSILEEKFPQLKEMFNEQIILKKVAHLKQYFLPLGLEQQEKLLSYDVPSLKNMQFVGLISIFVVLLLILGVQFYTQILSPSFKHTQTKPVVMQKNIPSSTPTPSLAPEETPVQ